jgi:hypothetical protein
MRHVALVRSLTNKEGNHQRATYQLHTGYAPTGTVKFPSMGAIASKEIGDPASELPHFVAIGGRGIQGLSGGFLGVAYDPFLVQAPGRPPENTAIGVSAERFARRGRLLSRLEAAGGFGGEGGAQELEEHGSVYGKAERLALSEKLRAFDLDEEPEKLRDAYGRGSFGQGCLLARRLVEAGVTFVEVASNGWDTHQDNFERTKALAGGVDGGFAQLVLDLADRGLLERTLVVWMGEFGRTPRINPQSGRDHYPRCFTVALAGGGVRGGQVVGASSADGTAVKDRPVSVPDFLASVYRSLRIDSHAENHSPLGRPVKVVDGGEPLRELFG